MNANLEILHMVQAELGPSSVDNTVNQTDMDDTKSIDTMLNDVKHNQDVDTNAVSRPRDGSAVDEPSTPGDISRAKHEDAGSETTSSPIALGLSAIDYAMRFDSTLGSEETQSKDPFVLDADTITLQHQRSRENASRQDQHREEERQIPLELDVRLEAPVSPVLTGEDVSRCSAVSPLHTQTLGIDETLMQASEPVPGKNVLSAGFTLDLFQGANHLCV